MRVRLLVALDKSKGLVREAEGSVVRIVVAGPDQPHVDEVMAMQCSARPDIYLRHVHLGVWVRMDKYAGGPFQSILESAHTLLTPDNTHSLIFVEPVKTATPFQWRSHTITVDNYLEVANSEGSNIQHHDTCSTIIL